MLTPQFGRSHIPPAVLSFLGMEILGPAPLLLPVDLSLQEHDTRCGVLPACLGIEFWTIRLLKEKVWVSVTSVASIVLFHRD